MLAVIEDEQELPVPQCAGQRWQHWATGFFVHTQHRRHSLRHERRVCKRRQFDQPDTTGECGCAWAGCELRGQLKRQAGFACAARCR